MNFNKFILTICIVTRNQPDRVDQIIRALIGSCTKHSVELIVNDGSTNSLTNDVVDRYNSLGNIRLIQDASRSLDEALINTLEVAQGEYIWNLGDDIPYPNAVVKILEIIEKNNDINFLWINSEEEGNPKKKTLSLEFSHYVDNKDDLLKFDVGLLGFISSTIYKKNVAVKCINDAKKFTGSIFVSLFIALSVLAQNGKIYIEKDALIKSKPKLPGEGRWYDPYEVFGLNIKKILNEFEMNFSKKAYQNAVKSNIVRVLRAIIYERSMGYASGFAATNFKFCEYMASYKGYPSTWIYIPALYLPNSVLKMIVLLNQFKKRSVSRLHIWLIGKSSFNFRGIIWRLCRRGYIYVRGDSYSDPSSNGEFMIFKKVSPLFSNDPVLIDIGANEGDWIQNAFNVLDAKMGKKIYALEPALNTYKYLKERFGGSITVMNIALGIENGKANLNIYGNTLGINSLHSVMDAEPLSIETVTIERFDDFYSRNLLSEIDYVKSDTEGNCFNVLMGAEVCLKIGCIKFWQFEYNYRWLMPGHSLLNVFKFIENKPYLLAKITNKGLVIYRKWHFELDRYFEANYILIRENIVNDIRDFSKNSAFDEFNVSITS